MSVSETDQRRQRVLRLLKRYGTHATSFQILEQGIEYWFDESLPEDGAVVAFARSGRQRVVAGVPLGPEELLGQIAGRFVAGARADGESVLFFSADRPLIEQLESCDGLQLDSIKIGEQPEWRPESYSTAGPERRTLRSQVSRATRKGVKVRRVSAEEMSDNPGALRAEIESVLSRWMASRRMSEMRFMVDLQPFHFPRERSYWIAEQGDRAVGFLAAVPVYNRGGWFFEDMIRVPDAPNGTVELMIDTAMRDVGAAGSPYVTLGLSPLAGIETTPGEHHLMRRVLNWCYHRLSYLYHFDGLRRFKARFHPDHWEPQYLVASPGPVSWHSFHAVLRAFAGGGLTSFGLDTMRRLLSHIPRSIWATVLALLGLLLLPWTAVLALTDRVSWFGDAAIPYARLTFDLLLSTGLCSLAWQVQQSRPAARPMAMLLIGATLADLMLNTVQALYALRGAATLFLLVGIGGSLLTTVVLALLVTTRLSRPRSPAYLNTMR